LSKELVITPDVIEASEYIGASWRLGVESIIETGRRLIEIRERFKNDRGKWSILIGAHNHPGELPFGQQHTNRLIAIAESNRLNAHVRTLPSDSYTLYQLTRLSDDRFDQLLEDGRIHPGMKRSEASAETRQESKAADEQRVLNAQPIKGKFKTLVIDPPWDYEWLSIAGRAAPGYATMTHENLQDLDVGAWAEDNCHLYLWTTNNFMTRAVDLMSHWGFQHKTVLTWVKPRMGLGSYFRNQTEHVLFGMMGDNSTRIDNITTVFEAPLGEHSEKPDIFYDIVKRASYPSIGEAFQRKKRKGFRDLFE
jgi:N6-adenosine-specific RNA methylase IME4|tara:strand:+ start:167 stop:1090 length:924 start_codon:yes stop_codon:yes gene_type:complete